MIFLIIFINRNIHSTDSIMTHWMQWEVTDKIIGAAINPNKHLNVHNFTSEELLYLKDTNLDDFGTNTVIDDVKLERIHIWASKACNYNVKLTEASRMKWKYLCEDRKYVKDPTIVTFLFDVQDDERLHGKWTHYYKICPEDWKAMLKQKIKKLYPDSGDIRIYKIHKKNNDGYESDDDCTYHFQYADLDSPDSQLYPRGQYPDRIEDLTF